jgi:transposase
LLPSFYKKRRRIYLIQDNASYHKKPEVFDWYKKNRSRVEVFLLPPYSPEYNATERIWQYTRKRGTHNRYFDVPGELCGALFKTFDEIKKEPSKIAGLLRPFF